MCCFFNGFALLLRVAGCSDDERFAVPQRRGADFIGAVGLTEVDCHITIFHRQFDCIAQIALRGDFISRSLSPNREQFFPCGQPRQSTTRARELPS